MASSREERMAQRMRGAQRHQVGDDSFGPIIAIAEEEPEPDISSPAPPTDEPEDAPATASPQRTRSTPNTSAKRRRLSEPPSSASRPSRTSSRRKTSSPADPYDITEGQDESTGAVAALQPVEEEEAAADTLESLPEPGPRPGSQGSTVSLGATAEEVTESPLNAPGSGHRRRVRLSDIATQSARLQRAVLEEDLGDEMTTSSPLARKIRKSDGAASAKSTRSGLRKSVSQAVDEDGTEEIDELSPEAIKPRRNTRRSNEEEEVDELSPEATKPRRSNGTASTGSAHSTRTADRKATLSTVDDEVDELSPAQHLSSRRSSKKRQSRLSPELGADVEEEEEEDQEEAEEIDENEAAARLGSKRSRGDRSPQASSEVDADEARESPPKKRRHRRPQTSPAAQKQGKAQKARRQSVVKRRRSGGEAIPITVQRFTKRARHHEDDADADILNEEIPFAGRGGVNVIDVLSQMCEEILDSNLGTLHEAAVNAEDSASKREYRTKLRALEAFQEELRTRLLEHTIALDTMHALTKRVRSVQKEKLSLRSDIMQLRAEREQVALKMDAVRLKHETESKASLQQLDMSSAMHDVDLAIERGATSTGLSSSQQKAADLANLELLISKVTDQACSGKEGGGSLLQIRNFNAFLERAAVALESR